MIKIKNLLSPEKNRQRSEEITNNLMDQFSFQDFGITFQQTSSRPLHKAPSWAELPQIDLKVKEPSKICKI